LDTILHDYQVVDDPNGMVDWEPNGNIVKDIFGHFSGSRRVTATEAELLDSMSVFELNDMRRSKDIAWDESIERFPAPEGKRDQFQSDAQFNAWAGNDGHRDAFRHAYWNALMTDRLGENVTARFATAHEGAPDNPADREAMDLYNNEVGRRIAVENPGASDEELADLIQDALENGELIVIDRSGNMAWSNQVAYGEHGFADDWAVPGVMQPPALNDASLSGN
jgi:hypothetical protein